MPVITAHIGNRETVTFPRNEQFDALASVVGEQWARYAYGRHLAFGENVVQAGTVTITWSTTPC